MRFVQSFTPPDFQAKTFTPPILPILNGLSDKTQTNCLTQISRLFYPKKVVFSGSLSYLSRPLDIRGEVALSFLLVRVSLDLPAIFQLPSTSLVFQSWISSTQISLFVTWCCCRGSRSRTCCLRRSRSWTRTPRALRLRSTSWSEKCFSLCFFLDNQSDQDACFVFIGKTVLGKPSKTT